MIRLPISLTIPLLVVGLVASSLAAAEPAAPSQDQLLAVLKGDADLSAKWDAAKVLARSATAAAVPALAELLGDDKLAHLGRTVLEAMPDPAAGQALRQAAGKLKGNQLAGVVQSLGARRDADSVQLLGELLGGADPAVAAAAAASLGQIATGPAVAALAAAEKKAAPALKAIIQDALLRCAEAGAGDGEAIYLYLRDSDTPAVRMGAVRGQILARGQAAPALLLECLGDKDFLVVNVALRVAAHELPGAAITQALANGLAKLPADRQPMLITALGHRGDQAALPDLLAVAQRGEPPLRLAAISALVQLAQQPGQGQDQVVETLAQAAGDADAAIASAAQSALLALPGQAAERVILSLLQGDQPARRLLGVQLAHRRMLAPALPALLQAARAEDPALRQAALRALSELATDKDLPALLDVVTAAADDADREAAERAITLAAARSAQPQAAADLAAARFQAATTPQQKASLLRLMRNIGGPKALAVVKSALADADLRDTAIRALAAWTDASAAADLLELAKSAPQPNHRMLAFRGLLRVAEQDKDNPGAQLDWINQAGRIAWSTETRRLVIGSMGNVKSPQSLVAALAAAREQADVRGEAIQAVLSIGESIVQHHPAPVRAAMDELLKLSDTPALREQVQAVLNAANTSPAALRAWLAADPARTAATAKALVEKAPKGYRLAWYLDCGPDTQAGTADGPRVRVAQGRSHIWPVPVGRHSPRYLTCTYWEQKVVFELAGLKSDKKYLLHLAWWDVDGNTRKGSVWAVSGDKQACLVKPVVVPSWSHGKNPPGEHGAALPAELTRTGNLKVEAREEGSPNVVVSELWLYEGD